MDLRQATPLTVDASWLHSSLVDGNLDIRVIDASWNMPLIDGAGQVQITSARTAFEKAHIPQSVFFDHEATSNIALIPQGVVAIRMAMPTMQVMQGFLREAGITNNTHIVVYDHEGGYGSAPRLWWLLRAYGLDKVSVLEGGLYSWKKERLPLDTGDPHYNSSAITPILNERAIIDDAGLKCLLASTSPNVQIIDCRETTDSIPYLVSHNSGPLQKAKRLAVTGPQALRDDSPKGFSLNDETTIKAAFANAGVGTSKIHYLFCYFGMGSCIAAFAMVRSGFTNIVIHPQGWSTMGLK